MASKADDQQARIEKRRAAALKLRRGGNSYRDIGQTLGVSHETARQDVNAALDRIAQQTDEQARKLRALEASRLERGIEECMAEIEGAEDYPRDAIRDLVKLSESLRKLYGLDEPDRIEHSHDFDADEAARRIEGLLGLHGSPEDDEDE